jgi:hypothetical protein
MFPESDERVGVGPLTTPFRAHLDHCLALDTRRQIEECADYIQHVELLVAEFLESYYLVERLWEPGAELVGGAESEGELILEPFYDSLELHLRDGDGPETEGDVLVCVSGAVSPLRGDQHPALSRRGLDFVGLRGGSAQHIVLGVAQASKDETPFLLLLRALNALAELSPPLRVVQLGHEIVRGGIPEDADFSLQLGVSEPDASPDAIALGELSRDLAESFHCQASGVPQLSGMLSEVACVEVDADSLASGHLKRLWRIPR